MSKATDSSIYLRAVSNTKPYSVGPRLVDECISESDGIWYPDSLKPRMAWKGGPLDWDRHFNEDEFDPFKATDLWSSNYFTERLEDEESKCMNWAMFQPGPQNVCASRGNRPIASQCDKPDWLSKVEFLTFGKLRAYPHMQLRNLCVALTERTLPFSHRAVHCLVRQALYHLGDIGVS
eukprot:15345662-Ditylum_brightwellii.AAC.1